MSDPTERDGGFLARVGRSAFILAGSALIAQAIVIARELYLAATAGVSAEFDALIIGTSLPMTVATVIGGGAWRALVPAYVAAETEGGKQKAKLLSGVVLAWIGLAGIVMSVLLAVTADDIVRLIGPGLDAAQRTSAAAYLRLLAPIVFVTSIRGILSAVLQAEEHFGPIALGRIAEPVVGLVLLLALWGVIGLSALAIANLLGPIVGLLVLLVALFRRRLLPTLRLWSSGLQLRAFARHAAPISLSLGLLQVNLVLDRAIATLIGPGAVTILRYANTLLRAPISVVGPAFGQAVYPALVRATHTEDASGLAAATGQTLRYVIALFTPLMLLTAAVAPVAVSAAYDRGVFTDEELRSTADVLVALSPLVLLLMVGPVLTGALNARYKGMVLLAASLIDIVVHATLAVVLGISIGVVGVALATSLTALITAAFFAQRLARIEPDFELRSLVRLAGGALVASAPAAIVIGLLAWNGVYLSGFAGGLLTLAVFGVAGIVAYVPVARLLGIREPMLLVTFLIRRVARGRLAA